MLPWRLSTSLNCWGGSARDTRLPYRHVYQECESEDSIYLDQDFETGRLHYNYQWFESSQLSQMQFYSLLEARFSHPERFQRIDRSRVGEFRCRQGFLRLAGLGWRMSWCARKYQRYTGLHDLSLILATADLDQRGLLVSVSATGIALDSATDFLRRFLGAFSWLN